MSSPFNFFAGGAVGYSSKRRFISPEERARVMRRAELQRDANQINNPTATSNLSGVLPNQAPALDTLNQNSIQQQGAISALGGSADNFIPDPSSSLVNPFGLQAQGAIGGMFGSVFNRQNMMGSALAKRACKYKNK